MDTHRPYFRPTTAAQRRLLFETWETTGDVDRACQAAHVGRRTFYYWKPRYVAGGVAALDTFASRARRTPSRVPAAVEAQVIALRQQHPDWGKQRIADELTKGNTWVPLVTPNTVKRILQDAGLWSEPTAPAKKGGRPAAVARPSNRAKP